MVDPNKPVRVFRNWKHGCYSIMQDGVIRASAREVHLVDVEFRVRESGRQRMLQSRKRNVHAFAVGLLRDHVHPDEDRQLSIVDGRGVHYDPARHTAFVDRETETPVERAGLVHFAETGVTYRDAA